MREVLEIHDVAEYGERDLVERKSVCECQQDVYRNYDVDAPLSEHFGKLGVLFDQL